MRLRTKIKTGNHRCNKWWLPFFYLNPKQISISFKIHPSMVYYLPNDKDRMDWNKLIGYSRGKHHVNSIRFGWRFNILTEKIEICEYKYTEGIRDYKNIIGYYNVGDEVNLSLKFDNGFWLGYLLTPYFGGNKTSPHDILFNLNYKIS